MSEILRLCQDKCFLSNCAVVPAQRLMTTPKFSKAKLAATLLSCASKSTFSLIATLTCFTEKSWHPGQVSQLEFDDSYVLSFPYVDGWELMASHAV